jgi:hypothetical protein
MTMIKAKIANTVFFITALLEFFGHLCTVRMPASIHLNFIYVMAERKVPPTLPEPLTIIPPIFHRRVEGGKYQ